MTSSRTVSRLSRILALIPYVLDRDGADVSEIIERFGYDEATLGRDLNTIFVCGLPGYGPGDLMEAFIDGEEVIIDEADFFAKAPRLTPAEALGLLASGMTVIGAGESSPELRSAVEKLTHVLLPDAESTLAVELLDESENLGVLKDAAAHHHPVRIVYRSVSREETTERVVEPWSVFAALGRWYVTSHCRLVDGQRTFRIDRIKDLEVLGEVFEPPDEIPSPEVGYHPGEGDISCVIDLTRAARWVLEYYPVEVVEEDPDRTRIAFHSADAELPARLLLRLGDTARLVEGAEVAARVKSLAGALRNMYQ